MNNSYSDAYKAAGVDVTAGYRAVELMKAHIARTAVPGLLGGIGGFGGLFALDLTGMPHPVLCAGTDGVGTKLKLAFLMDKHDTVGIDCVAMCVNDIVCCGAKPLFFLDYIACGKNVPEKIAAIVSGVAEGCVQAGCALTGGETAEMPGFYGPEEYDLAGFSVGAVDREKILDPQNVQAGDLLIGLASSGVHSNGFSLVRRVFDVEKPGVLDRHCPDLGKTLGEALLAPTKIYVKPVLRLLEQLPVRSIAHITGGGFYENIPRALPEGKRAVIQKTQPPALFQMIQREGGISEHDMYNTFNMGVGMLLVVPQADGDRALALLREAGEDARVIGHVEDGERGVTLC
ncbi:MAG TPA: phosphoribosylformylglycinamidine cyclo-ligase [Candidatus Anaerotruncus excrementipullorum]|uniref:Phosphoribosylformylglycinamidine cyclo-ligase n=1 Tax=Candidatus Anaerotruncus excrementipullorum TaxID=2838465 RepID=A0A9D1WQ86_9FIRM|nr:phosphoribosylformylglycinamidine cyclo-ligase [Candidatus Anaerotruncus excrementipullorum]